MRHLYLVLVLSLSVFGISSVSRAADAPAHQEAPSPQVATDQASAGKAQIQKAASSQSGTPSPNDAVNQQAPKPANEVVAPSAAKSKDEPKVSDSDYKIGIDDVLEIAILQPDKMELTMTVSPDGTFAFPYIGKVEAKGKTAAQVQDEIQRRLADGYLKYPVVSVALKQSFSKKFSVYGEVAKPGTYLLDEKATVLKAISLAGGLTKFGSTSRVKILRPKKDGAGYEVTKVSIKSIMNGQSEDVLLQPGDIVQVDEGMF